MSDATATSHTILLVDDEDALRRLTCRLLQRAGFEVVEAGTGAEALELAAAADESFGVLMTDVVLPQMSGKELADRLAAMHDGLKVVFASGYTDDVMLRHGLSPDDVTFLQKPFTPDQLVETVRAAVGS